MPELIRFIDEKDLIPLKVMQILSQSQDWGITTQHIKDGWVSVGKGDGITVAILDTGIAPHPDLNDNLLPGFDATGGNDPIDHTSFHGTHCAGIIAAIDNNEGCVGVAPHSKLLPIKVLDGSGCGQFSYIATGLRKAIDSGVDIINMSLGSSDNPGKEVENLINEATSHGIVVVAASGNNSGACLYPAAFDNCIAVSAIDQAGKIARFASKGANVKTAAPGVDIYSTWGNGGYCVLSGTSMACPFISGIVALLLSHFKENKHPEFHNIKAVMKLLQELGGQHIITDGTYNYGVPDFGNVKLIEDLKNE